MLALIGLALAGCDPQGDLDAAREALGSLDLAGADASLARSVEALACGRAPEGFLRDLLTLEGISAALGGRTDDATERFGLAKALGTGTPEFAPYGGAVAALWVDAPVPTGTMALALAPAPGPRWRAEVDGARTTEWPVSLPAGAHLVQIVDTARVPHLGRIVVGSDGQLVSVSPGLPERPPSAVPTGSARIGLSAGLGLDVAAGERTALQIDGEDRVQPGARVATTADLGLRVAGDPLWGRATFALGTLVGGTHLYARDDRPASTPLVWGGEIAGGLTTGRLTPGLAAGVRLPSRARVRAVLGVTVVDRLAVEPTVGLHVLTDGPAEPFAGLAVRVRTN